MQPIQNPIQIGEIPRHREALDFEVLRIECDLGIERLRKAVDECYSEHEPRLKDGYQTYSGLGLQYADAGDPIYDAVEQSGFIDATGNEMSYRKLGPHDFTRRNNLSEKFGFVFEAFSSLRLFRGRILRASPSHVHEEHIDGKRDCRIHIPIYTSKFCLMYFGDQPYHLKADGSAYLCNTSRRHQIVNFSNIERTHLVFVL